MEQRITRTATLKQGAKKVTVTCTINNSDQEFAVVGQATNNKLTSRCAGKGPLEASFKGTIDWTGRQMTGEWTTPAQRTEHSRAQDPEMIANTMTHIVFHMNV